MKKNVAHECELTDYQEELIYPQPAPFASWLFAILHQLRLWSTLCVRFGHHHFNSQASFIREKNRHLTTKRYRFIIHPFSLLHNYVGIVASLCWLFVIVLDTYYGCLNFELLDDQTRNYIAFDYMAIIYMTLEFAFLLKNFITGYPVTETRVVILEWRMIFRRYLKTWFLIDLIPPFCTLLTYSTTLSSSALLFMYYLRLLRWTKFYQFFHQIDDVLYRFRISDAAKIVFAMFIMVHLLAHLFTCIFLSTPVIMRMLHMEFDPKTGWLALLMRRENVTDHTKLNDYYIYLKTYLFILSHFYGTGYYTNTQVVLENVIMSLALILGLCGFTFAIALTLQLFGVVNVSESKYDELMSQINLFMETNRFPKDLQLRINKYYDFRYGGKFFNEKQILIQLSQHLQFEVLLYSCKNLVEKVQLFRGLSRAAVGCILTFLKQDIYMAGDVLISHHQPSNMIFLMLHGTCKITLKGEKEIGHIEDGDEFGDLKEWDKNASTVMLDLVAIESSEVYYLEKVDVEYITNLYPEIGSRIETLFKQRLKHYMQCIEMVQHVNVFNVDDILASLERGEILEGSKPSKWTINKKGGHRAPRSGHKDGRRMNIQRNL